MQDKNLCPLSTKKRTNECVLSVSGFVFCYVCIFKFVREHQRCPLTNYPCTIKNIIRIYDSSDWNKYFNNNFFLTPSYYLFIGKFWVIKHSISFLFFLSSNLKKKFYFLKIRLKIKKCQN